MPRTQLTYNQLLALRDDILNQQRTSACFFYFNKPKVDRFFSQNHITLSVLKSRMDEFITKYVKFDKDKQPITEEKNGTLIYTFYSPEDEEAYKKALTHFLSLKISIDI